MKSLQIDTYYDITCCRCGKSRSTDFEWGMAHSKAYLRQAAINEGWTSEEETGAPVCPECSMRSEKGAEELEKLLKSFLK